MPVELSRELLGSETVQARYKAGYGVILVKSKFAGKKHLDELLYEIFTKYQQKNFRAEQRDF
jgi:hypothetical protein